MGRLIALLTALTALSIAGWLALRPVDAPRQRDLTMDGTPHARQSHRAAIAPHGPATTETQRYRFTYRVELDIDGNAQPAIDIRGAWDQTPTADGYRIRLHDVALEAHEALPAAAALERTFGVEARDGVLHRLGFDAQADEATRRSFAALVSTFWLSRAADADARAWQAEESEMAGVFTAHYTRVGDQITKRIGAYRGLRGADGLDARAARAIKTDGAVRFDLDAQGVAHVVVDLTQIAQADADGIKVTTRTRATLTRTASDVAAVAAHALHFGGFDGLVDHDGQQETLDARRVGDADAASLLDRLNAANALPRGEKATQQARADLLKTMAALTRLEPEAATTFANALRDRARRGENTSLLAGALASAETAAATNALAGLIGEDDLPPAARRNAMNTLGLADTATPESVAALTEQLEGEMDSAAAMALGNQAKRIADEAPEQAQSAVEALLEGYANAATTAERANYLRALGNTGAREALPAMTAAIASNDSILKPIAISGLRFIPGTDVDELLQQFVFSGNLYGPAALSAVSWRSATVWRQPLQLAREAYAQVTSTAKLVEAIDRILVHWQS